MIFYFSSDIQVNASINEVFNFFSTAENLETITPPWLKFKILTPLPIKIESGTLIDYRLSLYGIPLRWQTEITVWEPPNRFIDCQRKGPYKSWIHEHCFEEIEGGCLIKDQVTYSLYGGILSSIINKMFVKKDVEKIFNYRSEHINSLQVFKK